MKTLACIAGLVAGLTTLTPTASADTKNVGGHVCMRYASSEAPKSAEYVSSSAQLCNDSEERLRVICPLTQDAGNGETVTATIDYVNWNSNGINGHQNTYPSQEFLCGVQTRTRYAAAHYWGGWQSAADNNGWGTQPTAMLADANEIDPGFMHVTCYIPEKDADVRSCVSHIRYTEE